MAGRVGSSSRTAGKSPARPGALPSLAQRRYLKLGLEQAGGKLPLFDRNGQKVPARTIRACLDAGWCRPWHKNPIEPDWLVCRLTDNGRSVVVPKGAKSKKAAR